MTIMSIPPGNATQSGTDPPFDSVPPPQISYIDPDGMLWPLSDLTLVSGYVCTGITGISGIPVNFSTIPLVAGGALPQLYIAQPGSIGIGIYLESLGDVDAYMMLLDRLAYSFYNVRNGVPAPGKLRIQRQDGTARQRDVYCISGADDPVDSGVTWASFVLGLQAPDPFWYDAVPQNVLYTMPTVTANGILPLLPIDLSANTLVGDTTVINDGGMDAYPIWTFTGPGQPTIINKTTGRQFSFGISLNSGQIVEVDTRPGLQSATDLAAGTNFWPEIVVNSPRDLFPLVRGENDITLAMAGSGSATEINLQWTRRWLRC